MTRPRLCVTACVATLLAAGLAAAGPAAQDEPKSVPLSALVAALGDTSFEARRAASEALVTAEHVSIDDMIAASAQPGLSAEQRSRLLAAAGAKFLAAPPPALGVRFNDTNPSRVELGEVFPGYKAKDLLAAGDVITAVHGRPVTSWDDVRLGIMSHVPGERIAMTVVRRGDAGEDVTLDLSVELGRHDSLPGPGAVNEAQRIEAFSGRVARLLPEDALGVTVPTFSMEAWLTAEGLWPPPAPDTPIGELGLAGSSAGTAARTLAPGGQPVLDDGVYALRRSDLGARQRQEGRLIGERAGMPEWWETLAAYRLSVLSLIEQDQMFINLGGPSARQFNTVEKLENFHRRRAQLFEDIAGFAEAIRAFDQGELPRDGAPGS